MSTETQPTTQMPPAWEPARFEEARYQWWEDRGYFQPRIDPEREPFTVIMPPPNVTGQLHLGHALTAAVEDALVRYHRMLGDPTLWLPGTDHAGIATQYVVENHLASQGMDRREIGREAFLEHVWEWVREYGGAIQNQHRRLGASCDWTRERFTLDEGPSLAVRTTFVNLYESGRIYRGERMINWCPTDHTALSDLETEYEDTAGKLWHINYPYSDGSGRYVTVATTRPETYLGDTAVAVNTNDPRFADAIGTTVRLPFIDRDIPIIGDDYVDMEFGTGALKVTPAHDQNDFEIGQRHGLESIEVIAADGTLNEFAGPFEGLERFEARQRIVDELESAGFLDRTEDYENRVGRCYRCQTIIEPRLSIQWFVNIAPLAERAAEAVRGGSIRIVPDRFTTTYLNWMDGIRDWCISRQLWWGHRIPAWFCGGCDGDKLTVILRDPILASDGEELFEATYTQLRERGLTHEDIAARADRVNAEQDVQAIVAIDAPQTCEGCDSAELIQDPDVLDTWFSSGLWPHSTLGWPGDTEDYQYFHPTSVLETGYDILFFWVARMIMMGLENTDDVPFRTVYLHGLVRDAQRQKMSKTRGNVIDPLESIAEYGTDALRMALTIATTPGNDLALTPGRMEAGRNFANKLWNAARFVVRSMEMSGVSIGANMPTPEHREDRWIISRLSGVTEQVNRLMADYQLGQAEQIIRDFLWDEFADWYIELAKVRLRSGDDKPAHYLVGVLEQSLRLLHPFMPFVTEEIWQNLIARAPDLARGVDSIMVAAYPQTDGHEIDAESEAELGDIINVIRAIRNARAESNIEHARMIETIVDAVPESQRAIAESREAIGVLARVSSLNVLSPEDERPDPSSVTTSILDGVTVMVPLAGLVDADAERTRLAKELEETLARLTGLEQRLGNEGFRSKAPAHVVAKEEERLEESRQRAQRIEEQLSRLA